MRTLSSPANPLTFPGPTGPADFEVLSTCEFCGDEIVGDTRDTVASACDGCIRLLGTDHEELVVMYRRMEARVA